MLDVTPFYAESGGQLADTGVIVLDGGARIEVDDVQAPVKGLSVHHGRLVDGTVTFGESGTATIDVDRRRAIARAHTATHLVHKALHESIGESATQAGSLNAPEPAALRLPLAVGHAVARSSRRSRRASTSGSRTTSRSPTPSCTIDEARGQGAMALFGEKYGNEVRVVDIGDGWSLELCAGTHVKRSGELGLVTLLSESAIGSGVRRVDALVGAGAYGYQAKERALVGQLSGLLGARPDELSDRVSSLLTKLKESEKELATLRQATLLAQAGSLAAGAQTVGETRVVTHDAGEVARRRAAHAGARRALAARRVGARGRRDRRRQQGSPGRRRRDERRGARARASGPVRSCATASGILGGGGGGKDDLAQGGGTDAGTARRGARRRRDGGERLT